MYTMYCRIYQYIFRLVSYILPFRKPTIIEGTHELPIVAKRIGLSHLMVITDSVISSLGLMDEMLDEFKEQNMKWTLYDKTVANPTIDNIEEALGLYIHNNCDGLVAFGGGSSIDCAKGVAARLARPKKSIPQMKGVLKVLRRTPTLFAVPTTSGTGSEATLAAVITNSKTHEKYAINDTVLIPSYAVLDPKLTLALPPHITSTTGMDALTHAVEAYIGNSNTAETKKMAEDAIQLVFENVVEATINGSNYSARENMQKASYYAGIAFTRAYVGNVHAIAHTLGGFYNIPHGLANAVILPYVLKAFGSSAHRKLAELEDLVSKVNSKDSDEVKANRFIDRIIELNEKMKIPNRIKGIQDKDIQLMVERAFHEANPLYPVPRIFSRQDFVNIYQEIKE